MKITIKGFWESESYLSNKVISNVKNIQIVGNYEENNEILNKIDTILYTFKDEGGTMENLLVIETDNNYIGIYIDGIVKVF